MNMKTGNEESSQCFDSQTLGHLTKIHLAC